MDILNKIDNYLNENKMQKALSNAMTAITSASNDAQLTAAAQQAEDYVNKYGHESLMKSIAAFFGSEAAGYDEEKLLKKFGDAIKKQRLKIDDKEMMDRVKKFKEENF